MQRFAILTAIAVLAFASSLLADEGPWPAPVEGFVAPAAGEHPRLFFRKADVPALQKKAATPEGKVIIARLKELLGGGVELPTERNPNRGKQKDGDGGYKPGPVGKTYTLWHASGYGMLYQLTGDKKYAELAQQCVQLALDGQRDRDNRYSFRDPTGALRAGPSLGAIAMAYDLNYDGWDPAFREKVALAIQDYNEGSFCSLAELARGARHNPGSNHWGCQVGGAGLALLAIAGDPGVDAKKIEPLLEVNSKAIVRQLTEGFGDGGMFWEGKGPGGIGSDTAFIPAIQAWRVAGGRDFVSPRPHAAAVTLIKAHELVLVKGEPWYPIPSPSSYGTGYFGPHEKSGTRSDRDGLSRGGQFAQGFGAIPDVYKPALLWTYNHIVEPNAEARTFDTVSPYAHRAVLALVNWPIGGEEQNPGEVFPRVHVDERLKHYSFRNQWTGTEADIVVNATFGARDAHQLQIFGHGEKIKLGTCPRGEVTHFFAAEDGSGQVAIGGLGLAVDFSKASGADCLVVTAGRGAAGKQSIKVGDFHFYVTSLGGEMAEPKVEGDTLVIGKQTIKLVDKKYLQLGVIAAEQKRPKLGAAIASN